MRSASIKAARLNAIYIPLVVFFGALATALVLERGGIMVLNGSMDIGTLAAFTAYAVGIFEPIQRLAGILSQCISAQANIERVTSLLEEKPQVIDSPEVLEKYGDFFDPHKENWEPIKGDIEFENVSFQYPDGKEEVLSNFNLKIRRICKYSTNGTDSKTGHCNAQGDQADEKDSDKRNMCPFSHHGRAGNKRIPFLRGRFFSVVHDKPPL